MRGTIALLAVVVACVFASSALAGNSSTKTTYDTKGATVQKTIGKAKPKHQSKPAVSTAPKVVHTGTLPFTGLDLGFIVAGGLLLVAVGASLRRVTRQQTPPTA
jgi:hypothetical protein